jgi:hypothetical protein
MDRVSIQKHKAWAARANRREGCDKIPVQRAWRGEMAPRYAIWTNDNYRATYSKTFTRNRLL